eukprot:PITA_32125
MHYFLGLEVWQQKGEIFLGQGRYATEILKRFEMGNCRPMAMLMITNWKKIDASKDKDVDPTLYQQLIGSLMYLVNTGVDICYAVNTLSEFMVEPKRAYWATTKHILRDCVQRGVVRLSYTPTGEQVADILTKALGKSKFDYFKEKMGMVKNPFQK